MRLLSLIAASLLPASSVAIFADEAYQVDYHHELLGLPQSENTFVHQPVAASKASLIYTLTDKSLVGAVNPKDGTVVWRQRIYGTENSTGAVLRAGGENVIATGAGSGIALWQASDGRLIWNHDYNGETIVKDVTYLETSEEGRTSVSNDVLVLYHGSSRGVERRDGETGAVKWQYADSRYGFVGSCSLRPLLILKQRRRTSSNRRQGQHRTSGLAPQLYARRSQDQSHRYQLSFWRIT